MNDLSVLMHDVPPSILIYGDMSMVFFLQFKGLFWQVLTFVKFSE